MSVSNWLTKLFPPHSPSRRAGRGRSARTAKATRRAPRPGLRLEALEERYLLSTLTVLNINDSGAGSLRADIAAAHSGDTIVFAPSLVGQTITLTSGELLINKNLTIAGPGAGKLTISGDNLSRVFEVANGKRGTTQVALSGLTISNGVGVAAAGSSKSTDGSGGGILVEPENPADLARALAQLCNDSEEQNRLGQAGREAVNRQFSAGRMAQETVDLYQKYLQ